MKKYIYLSIFFIPFLTSCSRGVPQNTMTTEPQSIRDTGTQSDTDTFSGSFTKEQKEAREKSETIGGATLNMEK